MYIIHHTFCSLLPQYCLNSMLQFCSKESVASCESSDQTPGAGSCSLDILEHRPVFLCEALALALNLRQCWRMGNPIHSVQERWLEQIQHHRVFKTTKAKQAFRISRIFLRLRRWSCLGRGQDVPGRWPTSLYWRGWQWRCTGSWWHLWGRASDESRFKFCGHLWSYWRKWSRWG